jgi:hypothetical protein
MGGGRNVGFLPPLLYAPLPPNPYWLHPPRPLPPRLWYSVWFPSPIARDGRFFFDAKKHLMLKGNGRVPQRNHPTVFYGKAAEKKPAPTRADTRFGSWSCPTIVQRNRGGVWLCCLISGIKCARQRVGGVRA